MADNKNGNSYDPPVPAETSTDEAFKRIHQANQAMRVVVVIALLIMIVMLGFGLVRLNQVYETEQKQLTAQNEDIKDRADVNRQLLETLTDNSRDTQYLICRIVTVSVPGREIPDEITKICGPVLEEGASQSAGEDAMPETPRGPQSFLAPRHDKVATN